MPEFIHSRTEGYLCRFQVLAIRNKVRINDHVHVFVWMCFQLLWINTKGKKITGLYVKNMYSFIINHQIGILISNE